MVRLLPLILLLSSCAPAPEGLRATPDGTGPLVTVDWDAEPLPELPFPNDLATIPDPSSPTGLRLNISLVAETHEQAETREKLNHLSGWGVYAPITVGFDAPLDLDNLYARHAGDRKIGPSRLIDDAMFVIDVTPGSPTFGQPASLDLGEGRFPMDVWNPARYFANDTRSEEPSIVFDTVDEDLDGDGVLDWGEDTDNDGVLDTPNVYPEGAPDHFADLLGWYERESNTLIARPVLPLREATTYAVVVTERMTGLDGQPVRSPWDQVHHLRQSEALAPLPSVLGPLGLDIEDVAFTWSFTTGSVTEELVQIRQGIHGEGPLGWLEAEIPSGIRTAAVLHSRANEDPHKLPLEPLIGALELIGEIGEDNIIAQNYRAFGDCVVGGTFTTPDFLVDKDDEGRDDSEEYFVLDLAKGTAEVAPRDVTFTCILPNDAVAEPPYDVVIWGHGYGSSRFEFSSFVWAMNRIGKAACSFDFPSHGLDIGGDTLDLANQALDGLHMLEFLDHLRDSRARDLDNDGEVDSGGDQWSADAFHTRDQVRQATVDWAQFIKSLQECGTGTMVRDGDGAAAMTCDWDGDGAPDIGGPAAKYYIAGGSLGGINASVAAPVLVDVTAFVPVVSGAGLLDIALRSDIGGALEAMDGRLMSPILIGRPAGGGMAVSQLVTSVTHMRDLPIGTLSAEQLARVAGGKVIIDNLATGVSHEGYVHPDGTFRVSIAADGLRPADKAHLAGIPAQGAISSTEDYRVPGNEGLGDRLRVRFESVEFVDGEPVFTPEPALTMDRFASDVLHEGVTMPAGSPLIAGSYGSGYIRSTPDVRKVATVFSAILEPGDPIAYSPMMFERPFEALGGQPVNVLHMPNTGDNIVSINTGIAQARAMGLVRNDVVDPRYGMSVDQWLVARRVVHGIEQRGPYVCSDGQPCLFDADDLDEGINPYGEPSDEPLRLTVETSRGASGMRIGYPQETGSHGFDQPDPDAPFQPIVYVASLIASYIHFDGQQIPDDLCMADLSCPWLTPMPEVP
jgi:hypothetical protein